MAIDQVFSDFEPEVRTCSRFPELPFTHRGRGLVILETGLAELAGESSYEPLEQAHVAG